MELISFTYQEDRYDVVFVSDSGDEHVFSFEHGPLTFGSKAFDEPLLVYDGAIAEADDVMDESDRIFLFAGKHDTLLLAQGLIQSIAVDAGVTLLAQLVPRNHTILLMVGFNRRAHDESALLEELKALMRIAAHPNTVEQHETEEEEYEREPEVFHYVSDDGEGFQSALTDENAFVGGIAGNHPEGSEDV